MIWYTWSAFVAGSRDNITMTDLDGNVLRKTELVIDGEHRMLDCMLLTPHGKVGGA